ncbi:unnamed protein product [Pleuronectes platessa]|uniref:Uncharacterized protein n=1 Tax=Pleuronectes platessa TaxID=8262 RepID=A0A9N7V9V6_PLEPL|nr:unnamed protein product [Pleuronectes platessa]
METSRLRAVGSEQRDDTSQDTSGLHCGPRPFSTVWLIGSVEEKKSFSQRAVKKPRQKANTGCSEDGMRVKCRGFSEEVRERCPPSDPSSPERSLLLLVHDGGSMAALSSL